MSNKTLVKALRPFAHANISAQEGRVYSINAGDALELEKAGFVTRDGADGKAVETQIDQPAQAAHAGDVVVDDAEDVLGASGAKMEQKLQNKARSGASTK